MSKSLKFYLTLLVLMLIGISYIEIKRPKPIDWTPYYTTNKKTPLGLYVWDKEIEHIFGKDRLVRLHKTVYEYFNEKFSYQEDSNTYRVRGTILAIDKASHIDKESLEEILYFVSHGNEAFISMQNLPKVFIDSLKIEVHEKFSMHDTVYLTEFLNADTFSYRKINEYFYFDSIDTTTRNISKLGFIRGIDDTNKYCNFIRLPYYNGYIYLHSTPDVFTNYHLLKNKNHRYVEHILSCIQDKYPIYLYNNRTKRTEKSGNLLRFILQNQALRWAWYLFLIGLLLFLIFHAKRKQRIVPIISPMTNTSIEFIKTIATLYFQENNYLAIFDKKITFFLERVRSEYHLETNVLDDKFIQKLSLKSGKNEELIQRIVKMLKGKRSSRYTSEEDLIRLDKLLEEFWTSPLSNNHLKK